MILLFLRFFVDNNNYSYLFTFKAKKKKKSDKGRHKVYSLLVKRHNVDSKASQVITIFGNIYPT